MNVLAIDPGNKESAYVYFNGAVDEAGKCPNETLLGMIEDSVHCDHMAIEMVQSFGMAVGAEVFETVYWIGRFCQASPVPVTRVFRSDVKMHLCQSMRAKDGNIRQALIDRFGPPGKKKAPGATYGLSGDMWSALAVAVTFTDKFQKSAECHREGSK